MPTVETALGPIETTNLGFTLSHEHIISGTLSIRLNWPHLFNREEAIILAREKLNEAYEAGVRTVVDLTTFDLGRDVATIREVAEGTKMQIILATGIHLRIPRYFERKVPDHIVELFVMDIEEGIAGTGVKAAAIKVATEDEVTPQIELMLRAAALTHRATGAPIMTHSNPFIGTGTNQQDIFEEEGVDLSRVVIGHSGDTEDLDYLTGIMDRGSTIGMDRYGTHLGADTEKRTDVIAKLCRRGYADRMVLSHDASSFSLNMPSHIRAERFPEWNYLTIPTKVIPGLVKRDIPAEQIETLTTRNLRRIFEQQRSY
jgi:phosphotriesterase-related protein